MKRKVIRTGRGSMCVTIPAKFVKEHHIRAGDDVEIAVVNHTIAVITMNDIEGHKEEVRT